jgi:RNA 3'-terminal phosphate cyclase (ATP)
MKNIDGSIGEGGGQVLRTCLSLSLITGQAFHISNIRTGRPRPGLRAQHLKAVEVAAKIGQADVDGAQLNSTSISFTPKIIRPGRYHCDIGTAGSTSLVLQTIFLPLSMGGAASSISISGGTHVPWSPSFDFLVQQWLWYLKKIGFDISLKLELAGFYPQGGGLIHAAIQSTKSIPPLNLSQRGKLLRIRGTSAVANLDRHIAERQRNQVLRRLGDKFPLSDIRINKLPSRFKGTTICLICEFEHSQSCYFALGKLGKPAEKVADEVADSIEHFLSTDATVDEFLADQILLPLAFAISRSTFSTAKITHHLITNSEVIQEFLPVIIQISGETGSPGLISIDPNPT